MQMVKSNIAKKTGIVTMLLAAVLVAIKGAAFMLSGSVAVLASLADSTMDMVVSSLNYLAIYYSSRPADEDHRYGHGKIEGLAALGQALLMSGVAVFLLIEAFGHLAHPDPVDQPGLVAAMMGISLVMSVLIIKVQHKGVVQSGSLAIEADRAHYSADMAQHGGVIAVLVATYFGAPPLVDLLCAVAIAVWMLVSMYHIACKGVDMILDRELPEEERNVLLTIIHAHPLVLGVHDLRTIRSGMKELIAFDIEADPQMKLVNAHAITRDLEREILKHYPDAEIMIHVDPHGEIEDSRHTVASLHH